MQARKAKCNLVSRATLHINMRHTTNQKTSLTRYHLCADQQQISVQILSHSDHLKGSNQIKR